MQVLNSLLYWPTITLSCPSNSGCAVDRQRCSPHRFGSNCGDLLSNPPMLPPTNTSAPQNPEASPPEAPFRLELCPRAAGLTSLADDDTNRAALLLFYPPASQFSQRVAADPGGHNLDFAKSVPYSVRRWNSEKEVWSEPYPLTAVLQFSSCLHHVRWQQVTKPPENFSLCPHLALIANIHNTEFDVVVPPAPRVARELGTHELIAKVTGHCSSCSDPLSNHLLAGQAWQEKVECHYLPEDRCGGAGLRRASLKTASRWRHH